MIYKPLDVAAQLSLFVVQGEQMKSRKLFAFENMKRGTKVRIPVPQGVKYNPEKHFLPHEESDYLGDTLGGVPYATFRTDDPVVMDGFLMNGYMHSDNSLWTAFFAYWKDQKGHAYMTPDMSGIDDIRSIGINTSMKSPADFMKVGKYTNRLLAALPKPELYLGRVGEIVEQGMAVWGKEVSWDEKSDIAIVSVEVDGLVDDEREISIRYVDLNTLDEEQKALVDGCIVISDKAVRVLGLSKEPRLGMAWRGTFGTQRGLGKGHILYKNDMAVDVVIYGPKTIVKTDKFFFGSMGELHVGNPHTDRQAFINFGYHRNGLAVELAKTYMRQVIQDSKNEADLRRRLLHHMSDLSHADMTQEEWILRRALAYGVSFLRFPGLFRRVVRYLMKKVIQCEEDARIPMDTVAWYGYVLPDPNAIDSDGDVHPDRAIPEGTIVFPDIKAGTSVACYRQPSENSNAWVPLKVIYKAEYSRFAGRGICLLGRGAHKVLGRLGGGDMDDQFVIVHDPKWVEAFHTMRPYPETEKLSAEITEEEQEAMDREGLELSQFTEELLSDIRDRDMNHYTNKHVSWQIDMALHARAGIGPVVNYGMMDLLLSDPDHKDSMFSDLQGDPASQEWLEQRPPYQAALLLTCLEIVIDGNVKDITLLRKLGDVSGQIKAFHRNTLVYPESMRSRIPLSRVEKGDYVLARSLTCRALESIRILSNRLSEIFVEREWAMVTPADKELRDYFPREQELAIRVGGSWKYNSQDNEYERLSDEPFLKEIWANEWRDELSKPIRQRDPKAYVRICDLLKEELADADPDMMRRLAVELYFQTYRRLQNSPKVDEASGSLRGYNDGLLWSPVFGDHFIDALREAQLSGFYKVAEIRAEYRRRLLDRSVVIQVRNHNIYIQDSDDQFTIWVGMLFGKSPDGKYRMDGGIVELRRPADLCQPDDIYMVAQKPLTRVVPSAKSVLVDQPKPKEPTGIIGKILKKALDSLK